MIKFEIGGRKVDPDRIGDAVTAQILKSLRRNLTERLGAIRHPETGEFPTIVVRGTAL